MWYFLCESVKKLTARKECVCWGFWDPASLVPCHLYMCTHACEHTPVKMLSASPKAGGLFHSLTSHFHPVDDSWQGVLTAFHVLADFSPGSLVSRTSSCLSSQFPKTERWFNSELQQEPQREWDTAGREKSQDKAWAMSGYHHVVLFHYGYYYVAMSY